MIKTEIERISKLWNEVYQNEKTIIKGIVDYRKKLNITQKELSLLTGLKQSSISRFENCENSPRLNTILTIILALDKKCAEENRNEKSKVL